VDRYNEGDLLKSEIVELIERSQIIVADLTQRTAERAPRESTVTVAPPVSVR